jgi:hypothetical protein
MKKLFWGLFLILCFVVTLPASWWLLAKADFGYAYLHDHAGIRKHIAHFAPKNIYRHDFENTSKQKRLELFRGIVAAIQNKGAGLEELSYLDNKGRRNSLLIDEEITHLKDVANLLEKGALVLGFCVLVWLCLVFYLRYKHYSLPPVRQQFANLLLIVLFIAVFVSVIGVDTIFNQLHIWAFPKHHQWLFYYEESLMSTMMKAPDLFAYIALMWFIASIILSSILCAFLRRLLPEKNKPA